MKRLPTHKQIAGFVSDVLVERIPDFELSTAPISSDTCQSGFDGEWPEFPADEPIEKGLETLRPKAEKLAEEIIRNSGHKFYRFAVRLKRFESYEVGRIPVRIVSGMDIRSEKKLFRVDVLYGG